MQRLRAKSNVVYIWQVIDGQWPLYWNGGTVWKIGVTSVELGLKRLDTVAKANGIIRGETYLCQIENAYELEKILLELGEPVMLFEKDGRTEFRSLSDKELQQAITLMQPATMEVFNGKTQEENEIPKAHNAKWQT